MLYDKEAFIEENFFGKPLRSEREEYREVNGRR